MTNGDVVNWVTCTVVGDVGDEGAGVLHRYSQFACEAGTQLLTSMSKINPLGAHCERLNVDDKQLDPLGDKLNISTVPTKHHFILS